MGLFDRGVSLQTREIDKSCLWSYKLKKLCKEGGGGRLKKKISASSPVLRRILCPPWRPSHCSSSSFASSWRPPGRSCPRRLALSASSLDSAQTLSTWKNGPGCRWEMGLLRPKKEDRLRIVSSKGGNIEIYCIDARVGLGIWWKFGPSVNRLIWGVVQLN